jgi:hypothetical protein
MTQEAAMHAIAKRFEASDEVTRFPNGEERIVEVLGCPVGLATFEPGWRWSNDVRPLVGADRCPKLHVGYALSGRLHVMYDDGSTLDVTAGDLFEIPPGHDAWVVGNQAVTLVDWGGRVPAKTA